MSHPHSFGPFAASTLWILISAEDLLDQEGLASHFFPGVLFVPLAQVDQQLQPEGMVGVLTWQGPAMAALS